MRSRFLFLLLTIGISSLLGQEDFRVAKGLPEEFDRYLTALARQCWETRAARVAQIRTPAEVAARQAYIRMKITESLGGFPERTPLNARITGTLERDGFRIEKLVFESLPNFYVTANVFVPTRGQPPYPAMLGVAGHSNNGKAAIQYQSAWISMARRGVLVLAYDPPGQGERSEYFDPDLGRSTIGLGTTEHTMAGIQCLLTGTNIARYVTWDGIRAFDYLLTRKDVDPKRIGVAGNSGGGTQSAYLAVAEPRLALAAPSCYITSWEKLWSALGPQDAEQVFVNFLKDGLDFPDFLIAFAPRPMMMLTAIRDFFPIEGARATYAEARRIYGVMGQADRVAFFEYDDQHGWSKPRREATYRFVQKWLNHRDDEGVEERFAAEPDANLNATPTGQLATSLKGETVASLNRALAEQMYPQRKAAKAANPAEVRALVPSRLALPAGRGAPQWSKYGEIGRDGYRIEKIALESEKGVTVPALVFVPASAPGRKPGILYIDSRGKSADASPAADIESLARSGHVVVSIDPRGWGEHSAARGGGGYTGSYQTLMRTLLIGKPLIGMQVYDALRAFDYLAARADVDPARIGAIGKFNGGVVALLAAALEPRIQKVGAEASVRSYMDIARAKQHSGITDLTLPGVLKDFDLPDIVDAIAPRAVFVVSPRLPTGGSMAAPEAAKAYRSSSVRVLDRAQGWTFDMVYKGW